MKASDMSDVTIGSANARDLRLAAAVLVYGDGRSGTYATVHAIDERGKNLRLEAGRPATRAACANLARALGEAATLSGFTPPALLYLGAQTIAWWRAPCRSRVFFSTPDDPERHGVGKRNAVVPHPGLVFAVTASEWYVAAVRGAGRPGPDTKLFRAPYFNVWKSGHICEGNVRLPERMSADMIADYERAFFDSNFTHPNDARGLVKHKGGAIRFWTELLDGRHQQVFPERVLAPMGCTLATFIKKLEKNDGRD